MTWYELIVAALIGVGFGCMPFYYWGYLNGYKAGMAYGMSKLEDYHQYTMQNIQSVKHE